ncbi:MAG TPA: hypothetical protein VK402_07680, partial [Blastococcus sp.]|nr:hypothetical protein [Blastococcus sp.]
MLSFPMQSYALLVRTDFTDDDAWAEVAEQSTAESPEGFRANVQPFSDPAADGADWESLRDAVMELGPGRHGSALFMADAITLASAHHPVLVVSTSRFHRESLPDEFAAMRPFRCVPSHLWAVEN